MVTCFAEEDYFLLRNLAVLPECQGKGLGRKLVEFVESEARRRALTEVRLWTREEMSDNIQYYQRLGYSVTHRGIVDDCARVYFRKSLHGACLDGGLVSQCGHNCLSHLQVGVRGR